MTPDTRPSVEELFHRIAAAPHAHRAALLEEAVGSDLALRRELESLLAADSTAHSVLDGAAGEALFRAAHPGEGGRAVLDGQRIGAYEIVRLVAGGGMGNVYEALQRQPRRTVALKLLRAAFASQRERRRFLYESELLGQLRHPNIAQIFESGLHESGLVSLPYFAMEFVADARPLTEYARERGLATADRLALFEKVCDAVQHGHQKGIVHRDLKPGNILVDASGVPKIIDYGVARAADAELRPQTLCTSVGEFIGTLQYMSPEQLRGSAAEVDTRSDVYALGLILHELVADRRPYEFGGLTLAEAVRAIESEPTLSLQRVERGLRGDLATIIRKAMAHDPARRYQSAGELADDIRRLLRNDPIVARPPSAWYLLRKFASRHRALVAATVVAFASLAAGATAATHWALEAQDERDAAVASAQRSERVLQFMERFLSAADPKDSQADLTVREAVDRVAGDVDGQFGDDPLVAARVHHLLGGIYARQVRFDKASEHLRAALAIARTLDDSNGCWTANTLTDLAWIVGDADPEEPERLFREALEIRRRMYGPDHPIVACSAVYLCSALHWQGRFAESEPILRDALADLERAGKGDGEGAAVAMRYLATALHTRGADDEAETLYRDALALQEKHSGPDGLEMVHLYQTFARFLNDIGRCDEAADYQSEVRRITLLRIGPEECSED